MRAKTSNWLRQCGNSRASENVLRQIYRQSTALKDKPTAWFNFKEQKTHEVFRNTEEKNNYRGDKFKFRKRDIIFGNPICLLQSADQTICHSNGDFHKLFGQKSLSKAHQIIKLHRLLITRGKLLRNSQLLIISLQANIALTLSAILENISEKTN